MDEADRGSEQEEKARAAAASMRRPVPRATGFCLSCGEKLKPGECFCPPESDGDGCLKDWERDQAAKRRNGR